MKKETYRVLIRKSDELKLYSICTDLKSAMSSWQEACGEYSFESDIFIDSPSSFILTKTARQISAIFSFSVCTECFRISALIV
jgi:hypothetical protein